jgi:hypothetical protein
VYLGYHSFTSKFFEFVHVNPIQYFQYLQYEPNLAQIHEPPTTNSTPAAATATTRGSGSSGNSAKQQQPPISVTNQLVSILSLRFRKRHMNKLYMQEQAGSTTTGLE